MTADPYCEERNKIAIAAMTGLIAGSTWADPAEIADPAFNIAEAMLREQRKRNKKYTAEIAIDAQGWRNR